MYKVLTKVGARWLAAAAVVASFVSLVAYLRAPGGTEQAGTTLDAAQVVVIRTPGGMLEVATLVKNEEFAWSTKHACLLVDCGSLLGTTTTRIRVPVHYVYRVPLQPTWTAKLQGGRYVLEVPAVEPKSPATVDLSAMEMQTTRGWLSPSTQGNRETLLRELQPELDRRAKQPQYVDAQRHQARRTVSEFAQKWLREQGASVPGPPFQVRFADEGAGGS